MKIPLIKPYITDEIKKRVEEVLNSGYLTEGPVTKELEESVKKYTGCKHAIAFTSCTTGLETALRCIGAGPGDEVIVPDFTYPATATVAPMIGATSVIVDVDKDNMLIDYDAIEEAITEKTKAIIPVSLFGNPLDYERMQYIKEKYNVFILEDAAGSIGAEWNGQKVGKLADMTVFSFHPRKFITTGEGGMLTTDNDTWAEWINSFKHFGMGPSSSREETRFDIIGTNYKLSNILAAVGLGQMEKIDTLLKRRCELANQYTEFLGIDKSISFPRTTNNGIHSYQSYVIFIENRDKILKLMREKGIEVQIGTYALHMHPAFQNNPHVRLKGPFPNSRWVYDHCLTLPLFHDLNLKQQKMIAKELKNLLLSK